MFTFISKNARRQSRNLLAGATFVFATVVTAMPVLAHMHNAGAPPDRLCAVLEMLGHAPVLQCEDESSEVSPEVQAQLEDLFLSVLPLFNFDVAVAAGWDTIPGGECIESPMGGMGYHLQNLDQLANGQLNMLRPEALLYAPIEDGSLKFVGVEYIIPGDLWDDPEPPMFLEQPLHFNPNVGPAGIWALHVWVVEENPNGIFADWNPDVSCEFAAGA